MFHISQKFLGDEVTLTPRIPEADVDEDHLGPRICAAPNIFCCLMGITGMPIESALQDLEGSLLHIYYTSSKDYEEAYDVPDYYRTKEVHFFHLTNFSFVGTFRIIGNKITF